MWLYLKPTLLLILFLNLAAAQYHRNQQQQRFSTRCRNPNGRMGTCVSIYDCQTLISVVQQQPPQSSQLDFVRASQCQAGSGRSPYVCCSSDTGYTKRPQSERRESPTSTVLFPDRRNRRNRYSHNQGSVDNSPSSASSLLPQAPTCGGVVIANKIYGDDAELNEFPWMALFEYRRRNGELSTNCAGSLINQRYVVTAAHCLTGEIERVVGELIAIRLGEYDVTQEIDCNENVCAEAALRIGIDDVIPHPNYVDKTSNQAYDIGLVRMERNVHYTDSIKPICLPRTVRTSTSENTQFTVAGWGRTLRNARSPTKQKVQVKLINQEKCARRFRERRVEIIDTQLCAGGEFAKDSCEGDSGGPLMQIRGGVWTLEGIVSFGYKCGLKDWPAIYTRVSSYDDWIRSQVRD